MRNSTLLFAWLLIMVSNLAVSQTWNGNVSDEWHVGGNWSSGSAPGSISAVTIPSTLAVGKPWPRLTNDDVTVGSLTLNNGSQLNVNGRKITVANAVVIDGATVSNSGAGAITIEAGAGNSYLRNSTFTAALDFKTTGASALYEAYDVGANTYDGDVKFTISAIGSHNISTSFRSQFKGDLTIERTAVGETNVLTSNEAASVAVKGDFSYKNHAGGSTTIGGTANKATLEGKVNIDVEATGGNPSFTLRRLDNSGGTGGGIISVVNPGTFAVNNNTLILDSFIMTGKSGSSSDLGNNTISGAFTYSDASGNGGYLTSYGNVFDGTSGFTLNSPAAFYESYSSAPNGNIYKGNAAFTANGSGLLHIGYTHSATFEADLSVTRTVVGATSILTSGGSVGGNFSYTNEAGGATTIGVNTGVPVAGTVNILTDTPGGNPAFNLYGLANATTGGTIEIRKAGVFNVTGNSLKVSEMKMLDKSGSSSELGNNTISGAFTYSDASGNGGYLTSYGNVFDGTSGFTLNSPAAFYESYSSAPNGNIYKGNAAFTANGSGLLHIGYTHSATFEADLSVMRTVVGATSILTSGGSVGGNFSYTNEAGGATTIGVNTGVPVAGTVNILTNASEGNPAFNLYGLANATTGGTIEIRKAGVFNVTGNSLKVSEMKMLDKSGSSSDLGNNTISGAFTYSDASGNGGYLTSYGNVFDGTSGFTLNSPAAFYESYSSSSNGNIYKDNAIFTRLGAGALHIAYSRASEFHRNLTIHSSAGLTFSQELRFAGNSDGTLQQTGSQPLQLAALTLDKSNNAKLVLGSPAGVSGAVSFLNGYLQTDAVNYFNFAGNSAGHSGAGDQSHIVGPVRKAGTNAFTFPVGNGTAYHPVSISAPGGSSHVFSAEYKPADPVNYNPESFESPLEKVSDDGYWDVQRLEGSSGVRLTLTYNVPAGFITEPDDLRVAHWSGAGWESVDSEADETSTNTEGSVTTNDPVTSFSPFALGTTNFEANPLPVRLAEFSATKENQAVVLQWTTTEERGFDRFGVEQSSDGKSWREIGRVTAKGTALSPARYTYVDNRPSAGDSYYRLRMADLDGSFAYSDIRMVNMAGSAAGSLSVYPNPATDHILISPSSTFFTVSSLELFDISGRKVAGIKESLNGRLDVRALPSGLYLVKVTYSNQAVESRRLVISR